LPKFDRIGPKTVRLFPGKSAAKLKRFSPRNLRTVELSQITLDGFSDYARKSLFAPASGELE
jgi:hypothetical protein